MRLDGTPYQATTDTLDKPSIESPTSVIPSTMEIELKTQEKTADKGDVCLPTRGRRKRDDTVESIASSRRVYRSLCFDLPDTQ